MICLTKKVWNKKVIEPWEQLRPCKLPLTKQTQVDSDQSHKTFVFDSEVILCSCRHLFYADEVISNLALLIHLHVNIFTYKIMYTNKELSGQVTFIKHLKVWQKHHLFLDQQVQTQFYVFHLISFIIGSILDIHVCKDIEDIYWSCYQSSAMLPDTYLHHLVWMCEALCASETSQCKPKSITFTLNGCRKWSTIIIFSDFRSACTIP